MAACRYSLLQQPRRSVVHGITPLLHGIGCVLSLRLDESLVPSRGAGAKFALSHCFVYSLSTVRKRESCVLCVSSFAPSYQLSLYLNKYPKWFGRGRVANSRPCHSSQSSSARSEQANNAQRPRRASAAIRRYNRPAHVPSKCLSRGRIFSHQENTAATKWKEENV